MMQWTNHKGRVLEENERTKKKEKHTEKYKSCIKFMQLIKQKLLHFLNPSISVLKHGLKKL